MPQPVLRQPPALAFARLNDQLTQEEGEALVRRVSIVLPSPGPDGLTTAHVGASFEHGIPYLHVLARITGYVDNPRFIPAEIVWFPDVHSLTPSCTLVITPDLLNHLLCVHSDIRYQTIYLGRRLPAWLHTDGNLLLWTIQTSNLL